MNVLELLPDICAHAYVQVAVVQFSNDVRVEVAPQHMQLEELKRQLSVMVRFQYVTAVIQKCAALVK